MFNVDEDIDRENSLTDMMSQSYEAEQNSLMKRLSPYSKRSDRRNDSIGFIPLDVLVNGKTA